LDIDLKLFLALFCLVFSVYSQADSKETEHLLAFVGETECLYERNGKQHNGLEALKHINKKYTYFKTDIKTTEDFIPFSISKYPLSAI
jgi:hypothetical protein